MAASEWRMERLCSIHREHLNALENWRTRGSIGVGDGTVVQCLKRTLDEQG